MSYSFGWLDPRKFFMSPRKKFESELQYKQDKLEIEMQIAHMNAITSQYYPGSLIGGTVTTSGTTSMPWGSMAAHTSTDKDLGQFSIKSVENGFLVTHTKGWKSTSHIAADLEALRDLIVTTLVSNELDK